MYEKPGSWVDYTDIPFEENVECVPHTQYTTRKSDIDVNEVNELTTERRNNWSSEKGGNRILLARRKLFSVKI